MNQPRGFTAPVSARSPFVDSVWISYYASSQAMKEIFKSLTSIWLLAFVVFMSAAAGFVVASYVSLLTVWQRAFSPKTSATSSSSSWNEEGQACTILLGRIVQSSPVSETQELRMMSEKEYNYQIIRYIPDLRRMEPQNIGVLVQGDLGTTCRLWTHFRPLGDKTNPTLTIRIFENVESFLSWRWMGRR